MNMLITPLVHRFSKNHDDFRRLTCTKRGTGYMEIRCGFLIFRDFLNYSSPMSLGTVKTY